MVESGGDESEELGGAESSAKVLIGFNGRNMAEMAKMSLKAQSAKYLKFFIFLS